VHMRTQRAARVRHGRLVAVIGAMAVLTGLLATGASSASAATVKVIHPGDNVLTAMEALRAGGTLELAPGTYNTGLLRVTPMANGTASAPITITAQDPSNPPLLMGGLWFYSPTYINLTNLRVQATAATFPALTMQGGSFWTVSGSEFWGARQTNAYANVVISGTGGFPRFFTFASNCVHDAADSTRADATDHNVYVNFEGSGMTSGTILRNLMWGAPHGENLKLGNGGVDGALGPWNVRVANNTMAVGGRQLLLHANVRNNVIVGNLFYDATQGFVANPKTTQVYVHDVIGPQNYFSHNYSAIASMMIYDPASKVTLGAGNVMGAEPVFQGAYTCSGWRQTLPASLPFGRWGTSTWAR
jgi:hypothetical protein